MTGVDLTGSNSNSMLSRINRLRKGILLKVHPSMILKINYPSHRNRSSARVNSVATLLKYSLTTAVEQ